MRLGEAQITPPAIGDLALHLQCRGNLALSTRLSRALVDGEVAIELNQHERRALIDALDEAPAHLANLRDQLAPKPPESRARPFSDG